MSPEPSQSPAFSISEINSFLAEGWRFVERETRRQGHVAFLDPVQHRPSPFADASAVYIHVGQAALAGSDLHRRALMRVREVCPEEWEMAAEALKSGGLDPEQVTKAPSEPHPDF